MRRYPVSPALIGVLGFVLLRDAWQSNDWSAFWFLGIGFVHQCYLFWRTDRDLDA
jgi:hypothetical protein